jgi:hypothetical protein
MKFWEIERLNVDRSSLVDDVLDLEEKYYSKYSLRPYNVSHWNPSDEFRNIIMQNTMLPHVENITDYYISTDISYKESVLLKLGYLTSNKSCLITPTGSISILCAINWLQHVGITSVNIITPCYYTIPYHFIKSNISVNYIYARFVGDKLSVNEDDVNKICSSQAIWITNPLFSAGIELDHGLKIALKQAVESGAYVISDECLSFLGNELGRSIGNAKRFMGIHCPHKVISTNGIKFSVVVFDRQCQDFFEVWADILYGSLLHSNIVAINQFITSDFDVLINTARIKYCETLNYLNKLTDEHRCKCSASLQPHANYVCLRFPFIDASRGLDTDFMWELIKNTGASIIPGNRYLFHPDDGFLFRVNLGRDCIRFRASVTKIVKHLCSI